MHFISLFYHVMPRSRHGVNGGAALCNPTVMATLTDVDPAIVQAANALKDEGNVLLSHGKFSHAAEKYTEAINLYPTAIFYSNRAQALIKLEAYGQAIMDANDALK